MLVSHGHTNAWLPSNGNAWYSVIIRAHSTQVLEPSPAGPAMVGPPLADLIINFKPQFWCLYKEKGKTFCGLWSKWWKSCSDCVWSRSQTKGKG